MPMVMPVMRLVYFVRNGDDIPCCGCGKPVMARSTSGPDFTVYTCTNGAGGRHCGERLLLLHGRYRTTIVRLSKAEVAAIDFTEDANEVLKDIRALAEAVRDLGKSA